MLDSYRYGGHLFVVVVSHFAAGFSRTLREMGGEHTGLQNIIAYIWNYTSLPLLLNYDRS